MRLIAMFISTVCVLFVINDHMIIYGLKIYFLTAACSLYWHKSVTQGRHVTSVYLSKRSI